MVGAELGAVIAVVATLTLLVDTRRHGEGTWDSGANTDWIGTVVQALGTSGRQWGYWIGDTYGTS